VKFNKSKVTKKYLKKIKLNSNLSESVIDRYSVIKNSYL